LNAAETGVMDKVWIKSFQVLKVITSFRRFEIIDLSIEILTNTDFGKTGG